MTAPLGDARQPGTGWRFTRRYALAYAHWYAAGAVALVVTNGLSVTIPVVLADGIDALQRGAAGRGEASWAAAEVAAMGAAVVVVRTLSRLLFFTPGRLVEAAIHRDLFRALLRQQPGFFARFQPGDLTSRFTSDIQNARLLFGFTALGVVNTVTAAVLAAVRLVELSPVLGLVAAAPLLVGFAGSTLAVNRMRDLMRRNQEALGALSEHALTSFQGIACVHAFDAGPAMRRAFGAHNDEVARMSLARSQLRVAVGPLLGLAATIDVFLVLWFGGLTAGEIVAFAAIVAFMVTPLRTLTFTLSIVRQAAASLERLDEVLSAPPDRPDLPHPAPAPTAPPSVSVRGLSFRYPGADRDALSDVSFELGAGQLLGVFGATGSGKSTLVRCLLRLAPPPPGSVLVDGVDLVGVDLDGWRRAAALVPQRAFLFSESVRDNIVLGADPARLGDVIGAAQLEVDVAALPDGLDTVVGEAGLTLSGGQRQRVALARGLLREAPVLVLDDVLSAVDPATEAALLRTLSAGLGGARPTRVIVSNRISAIRAADRVLVLDRGRVIDQGTHAELVARPGPYREACLRQAERT